MLTEADTPSVRAVSAGPGQVDADLICAPVFEDEGLKDVHWLDLAVGGSIGRAWASGEITGKTHELFFADVVDSAWQTRRVLLVGAGASGRYDTARARTVAGAAGMAARARRVRRLACVCRAPGEAPPMAQATVEGILHGAFRDSRFKSEDSGSPPLKSVELVVGEDALSQVQGAVERGTVLAACSNLARELSNEPANLFTPRVFADRALGLATGPSTTVEVLDEEAIASHGMGLLQGVAQGSVEPARVIVMRYDPDNGGPGPVLGLVGKGVTFDSGGISIKPADGMERMKRDMAGGAAVVCAMRAIGRLGPAVRVIGVVPAAENMPGGGAIRPGDVLTAANGKRVEVLNTDAEGRLILGDALTLAQRLGATHLVDIATLTGACVVALGHHASGLLGAPADWVESVRQVADRAGERVWPLPVFEEYADQLKSETADLANTGGRTGGAITAGMFLKAFSGGLPWAHLDIAGTAWHEEAQAHHTKGATGVGVRLLAALPFDAKW
jgi:leucyl aminopeptidase|tara:strand:- start:439 stop:1944 length:1506 start_codon:yes stop_codon:yes gene_type:complete